MPSKYYEDNWEKANEWLRDNAPDYVLATIEEAFQIMSSTNLNGLEKVLEKLNEMEG